MTTAHGRREVAWRPTLRAPSCRREVDIAVTVDPDLTARVPHAPVDVPDAEPLCVSHPIDTQVAGEDVPLRGREEAPVRPQPEDNIVVVAVDVDGHGRTRAGRARGSGLFMRSPRAPRMALTIIR